MMYSTPIKLKSAKAEIMTEQYHTGDEGDVSIIWITFEDGKSVSIVRTANQPDPVIRGWLDEDDGPVMKEVLRP